VDERFCPYNIDPLSKQVSKIRIAKNFFIGVILYMGKKGFMMKIDGIIFT